jgi:hypothetical protein
MKANFALDFSEALITSELLHGQVHWNLLYAMTVYMLFGLST